MMRSQVAAVIAGRDANYPGNARRAHSDAGCLFHGRQVQAVYDDLINRIDSRRQSAVHQSAEGRAECIVGAGPEFLVAAADFAAAADDASRKWQDDAGYLTNGRHRGFRPPKSSSLILTQDEEIPAC